jgi:DNA topoisomerase-1
MRKKTTLRRALREDVLARGIAVPPSYTHVRLNPDAGAKLQATARTPKGKTAYFYHKDYVASQQREKWERVALLRRRLTAVVGRIDLDAHSGVPEAIALRIVLQTGMRNGNPPQGEKPSFGVSSLLLEHVTLDPEQGQVVFDFPGKHGVQQHFEIEDDVVYAYVLARQPLPELPDPQPTRLFDHDAKATLAYLRSIEPTLKVHDLRAWLATELALAFRAAFVEAGAEAGKKLSALVAKAVAQRLGNTPGAVRKAYLDPTL